VEGIVDLEDELRENNGGRTLDLRFELTLHEV
jgi:hypothetical protein